MSDILIKNTEMPNTCRMCIEMGIPVRCRVVLQEAVTSVMSGHDRPSDCPLVALPEHGRLIDADKLKKDNPMHMQADVPYVTEVTVEEIIDDAPTVLEASTGPITGFVGDGTEASK